MEKQDSGKNLSSNNAKFDTTFQSKKRKKLKNDQYENIEDANRKKINDNKIMKISKEKEAERQCKYQLRSKSPSRLLQAKRAKRKEKNRIRFERKQLKLQKIIDEKLERNHLKKIKRNNEVFEEGQIILGCITQVTDNNIAVSLLNEVTGLIPLIYITKSYNDLLLKLSGGETCTEALHNIEELYNVGDYLYTKTKSVIIAKNAEEIEELQHDVILSALVDEVNSDLKPSMLSVGSIIQCAVTSTEEYGYVMDTGIEGIKYAYISKQETPKRNVGVGSVFLCAVKEILNRNDELTLKLNATSQYLNKPISLAPNVDPLSLMPGTLINAEIQQVLPQRLRISLPNCSSFTGYVTKRFLQKFKNKDSSDLCKVGESVRARILYKKYYKQDPFLENAVKTKKKSTLIFYCNNKRQICYRLNKFIKGVKDEEDPVIDLIPDNEKRKKRKIDKENTETEESQTSVLPSSNLKLNSSGFDWSGQIFNKNANEDSSSEEEIENTKEQKSIKRLSKYEKAQQAKADEKKTRELELERLDPDREPETALDYEEKIEKTPHASAVWIEYISFHLENAETEKAKAVATRALKIIPFNMETERLALWNVVLRLEVMYGTAESIQKSFKEAAVTNDELKIIYIMLDIYTNASKIQEAVELMKVMTKKFSQTPEVWIRAGSFYFKIKKLQEARNILDKSLLSLPIKDHLEVINRFAQFELKYGDAERGKTIFEKIVSNFPRRLDLWNVYADQLIKINDIQGARNVIERITGLKLKMKSMRSTFKRLLDFETQYGTAETVKAVKTRIENYVETALRDDRS